LTIVYEVIDRLGCGLVGSALIEQISDLDNSNLRVIVIANSKKYLSYPGYKAIDLPLWKREFQEKAKPYSNFDEIFRYLTPSAEVEIESTIVIDSTASDELPKYYAKLLQAGHYIATANKKGLSGSSELCHDIQTGGEELGTRIFYEATVGAGLPIISTLQDLIESGDRVDKIEGIFSGTLSYIFNVFGGGDAKFSEVVKEAKENGYTEPDPRDDLNGMDVARKLTILARTLDIDVEGPPSSSIFPIESLIPPALEKVLSGDEFLAGLPAHDAEWDEKRTGAKNEGKVLRYVGSIDATDEKIKVGLQSYVPL